MCIFQNFFKDPWNTFDFITVIGSIVDALVIEFGVSKKKENANALTAIAVRKRGLNLKYPTTLKDFLRNYISYFRPTQLDRMDLNFSSDIWSFFHSKT